MSTTTLMQPAPAPLTQEERLELANQLYRKYYIRCFWHCRRNLVITEDLVPVVVDGLRKYGGRKGFMLTGKLQQRGTNHHTSERELLECR